MQPRLEHLLILLACVTTAVASQPDTQPNLLLLLTDNQPSWALRCAGTPLIHTPHLDQLARDGVRFTNAFVTTPVCAASRASILTGLYRRRHGFTFLTPPLRASLALQSYPALLRRQGYRTGCLLYTSPSPRDS